MTKLWGFIDVYFSKIIDLLEWFFDSFINIFESIFYFIFSVILFSIETAISAVSFVEYAALQALVDWNLLPTQIIWLLDYLDFGVCLSLLASAYTIRLGLNLIPGVVTRI